MYYTCMYNVHHIIGPSPFSIVNWMNEHRATKDLNWVRIPLGSFFFFCNNTNMLWSSRSVSLHIIYPLPLYYFRHTVKHTQANPRNVLHSLVIVVCNVYNNYMYLMYSNIYVYVHVLYIIIFIYTWCILIHMCI